MKKIIIIGSGNAALCAAISALEHGAQVTILEAAPETEAGGNSMYTAGAMRFVYNSKEDLLPLLNDPNDERIPNTEFGSYSKEKFQSDLLSFNDGKPLSLQQNILIDNSYETLRWLSHHNIKFDPIYSRQTFEKDGKFIFWGGLTLEAEGEGEEKKGWLIFAKNQVCLKSLDYKDCWDATSSDFGLRRRLLTILDQPFHNFRASKSFNRTTLCS